MPVRTAHGVWAERDGVLVRLEDETGRVGYGEAAPIPKFGAGTVDEIEAACRELGASIDGASAAAMPANLRCLQNALAAARGTAPAAVHKYLGVAALLPAGRPAIDQVKEKAESGFRIFKWKVGVGDLAEELGWLDDVCAVLPPEGKLRLDANGAWDRRKAERWLERCAERPVEFVEQPCLAKAAEGAAIGRRVDDMLLGLAADYPTPIALDESVVGEGDIERWLGAGWPGIFVVKPSLLGDVPAALSRLATAKAELVFSSALETAVGARAALQAAFAYPGGRRPGAALPGGNGPSGSLPRALGFGVWPLFSDNRFNGPAAAPYLRSEDLARIDVEAAWNALS